MSENSVNVGIDVSKDTLDIAVSNGERFGAANDEEGLARLPRRARRALQRRWRRSLGGLALLCALGQAPALAATITVDGTSCTLIDAVTAANNDAPAGGCSAGSGADTLVLSAASTHTLTAVNSNSNAAGLPRVTSAIVIDGNGSTITRDPGAPQFRILEVAGNGNLTLEEPRSPGAWLSGLRVPTTAAAACKTLAP